MRIPRLLALVLLASTYTFAQSDTPLGDVSNDRQGKHITESALADAANRERPVEVLSDTLGVDFQPYLNDSVIPTVRKNWHTLIPDRATPPTIKQGKVAIELAINKSGKIEAMKLTESSGDLALDRAAWESIKLSNPFAPLPAAFRGNSLQLRFHYYYDLAEAESDSAVTVGQHSPLGASLASASEEAPVLPSPESKPPSWLFDSLPRLPGFRVVDPGAPPVFRGGSGMKPPRVTYAPDPIYPWSGSGSAVVVLWLIVDSNGLPRQIKVARAAGHGFDEAAIDAVKRWKFHPATKDGRPVAVQINVEVAFRQ